jgi:thiol-disulfide isomerase/thioredoxin
MRRVATLLLVSALLALAGCTDLQGTEGKEYVGGDGQMVIYDRDERGEPVEASGPSVDGGELDLADYRGQVVVANVWWSQCGPCRKEMPLLQDVANDLGDDAVLLGINVRETGIENARAFERALEVDFPSFYDPGSEVLLAFDRIAPNAIPSTAILDREGRVAALVTGEIRGAVTLRDVVEDIAAEGT